MKRPADELDYLTAEPTPPKMLTWYQAHTIRRPRRCNVPWHRLGGAECCDHCTNQSFTIKHVLCLSSDDPPVFRPRRSREEL